MITLPVQFNRHAVEGWLSNASAEHMTCTQALAIVKVR